MRSKAMFIAGAAMLALVAGLTTAPPAAAESPFPPSWSCKAEPEAVRGPYWECRTKVTVTAGKAGGPIMWAIRVARREIAAQGARYFIQMPSTPMVGCQHLKGRQWRCSSFWAVPYPDPRIPEMQGT